MIIEGAFKIFCMNSLLSLKCSTAWGVNSG
jgi:hypothetical protein